MSRRQRWAGAQEKGGGGCGGLGRLGDEEGLKSWRTAGEEDAPMELFPSTATNACALLFQLLTRKSAPHLIKSATCSLLPVRAYPSAKDAAPHARFVTYIGVF